MQEISVHDVEVGHGQLSLFDTYRTMKNHYDELCASEGTPRGHWTHFVKSLDALGAAELEHRRLEARRQILDNGVSYTVYDDPQGVDRPWELDPIPVLIDSKEWAGIEAGLIQRAELLNLILKDIYGPRDLIRKGLIPQEVIFKHSGFARACCGVPVPGPHSLILYGADLVRDASGQIMVIADRSQAPSGSGYALENRMVTSRVLPSLFRDSQVHRLALYFRSLRMTLSSIAPHHNDDPNIVILSPGPLNETYFEHAYLANYLGYPLVQGSDLTVRDSHVWLKSLNGLQRVDVIFRRLDDSWSDPLELRGDSQLGVPGILEAVRCGNVALANPLGSSVLENPGLMPFLPDIARHFFGTDLLMPSAETWWCGKNEHLSHVLAHLDELVIKHLSPLKYRTRLLFPCEMSVQEKEDLRARLQTNPDEYAAQAHIALSTVPAFQDGHLQPRQSVLRSFAVARDDAYIIMPGGLTRIAPSNDQLLISNQVGGISKDTWVLASEPEKQITLWMESDQATAIDQLYGSLSSRIAENLFWLGRYAERSEGLIRLLRKIFSKWLESYNYQDQQESNQCAGLQRFIHGILKADALSLDQLEAELVALVQNHEQGNSLVYNLQAMLHNAQSVRERLSSDTLYAINTIKEELAELREKTPGVVSESLEELDALISALMAFSGLAMESLSRDQDWLFLDLGRRVERAYNLITLLNICLVEPCSQSSAETTMLETLLAGSESLMSYRRRYRSHLHINGVLELLLLDERHPRSLAYQFARIEQHIADLPLNTEQRSLSKEQKIVLRMNTRLKLTEARELGSLDPASNQRDYLRQFLEEMEAAVTELSDVISEHYFTHVQPARQLAPLRQEGR